MQPGHDRTMDAVFRLLVAHVEKEARAELANRLAHIPNAPAETIRRLASDDEIGVADPVLRHSTQLDDADLRRIAGTKGQGHLLAISARPTLTPPVTDILVSRGNREVLSSVAGNAGARFSEQGFAELVERAAGDEGLQERLAERGDLSPARMQSLLPRDRLGAGEAHGPARPGLRPSSVRPSGSRWPDPCRCPASAGAIMRPRRSRWTIWRAPIGSTRPRWPVSPGRSASNRPYAPWPSSATCRGTRPKP